MSDKIKNNVLCVLFLTTIIGFMFVNIIKPDTEISYSERRKLDVVPTFTYEKFLNGDIFQEYEEYFLDQFIFRDRFRTLKAIGRFYFMGLKDNNGIYLVGNGVYKMEYPINRLSVQRAAEKFNNIRDLYLQDMNVYYSIIPDKNYFVGEENGYLSMDYKEFADIMREHIIDMTYIDIFEQLTINDYYRTDLHWRQEAMIDLSKTIFNSMNQDNALSNDTTTSKLLASNLDSQMEYEVNELYPFYGSYYGQSALPIKPDSLIYLTNDTIRNVTVYNPVTEKTSPVYDLDQFNTVDSYNIFLSGPVPLLVIENKECENGKELYLFRDSYGSSLAPLLVSGYSKITLIDLRYIVSSLLEDYISFAKNSDVLFLYGTGVLNQSAMLR